MPPHCDTLDGPVVTAAQQALATGNVNLILPWAPKTAEREIKAAFRKTLKARLAGKAAAEVADQWFFETVVRLHRAGEGAAYTGLKPAGLDWGPVVPRADEAVAKGDPQEVVAFLQKTVAEALEERFHHVLHTRDYDPDDVAAARSYVQATLGFVLYAHGVYSFITTGEAHGEDGGGGGGHQH